VNPKPGQGKGLDELDPFGNAITKRGGRKQPGLEAVPAMTVACRRGWPTGSRVRGSTSAAVALPRDVEARM